MGTQADEAKPTMTPSGLRHPFAIGSAVSIVLGAVTLLIELQDPGSFESPLAATLAFALIFGYFPLAFLVSPGLAAVFTSAKYHNTKGIRRYFGGAALFGLVFSLMIAYVFFVLYSTTGA